MKWHPAVFHYVDTAIAATVTDGFWQRLTLTLIAAPICRCRPGRFRAVLLLTLHSKQRHPVKYLCNASHPAAAILHQIRSGTEVHGCFKQFSWQACCSQALVVSSLRTNLQQPLQLLLSFPVNAAAQIQYDRTACSARISHCWDMLCRRLFRAESLYCQEVVFWGLLCVTSSPQPLWHCLLASGC